MQWSNDMREISGFGGGYEEACQRMVRAGVRFLEEVKASREGLDEAAGSQLFDAVAAEEEGCTGAMAGAAANHAYFIYCQGWAAYVEKMKALKIEEEAERPIREAEDRARRERAEQHLRDVEQSQERWLKAAAEVPSSYANLESARENCEFFAIYWGQVEWTENGYVGPERLIAYCGSNISDVCRDLFTLAKGLGREVALEQDFNGVSVSARPDDASYRDGVQRWTEAFNAKHPEKP